MVDVARLERTLDRGREAALARMVDTFDIKVATGGWVFQGGEDIEALDLLFTTPGYIPPAAGTQLSQSAEVGGRTAVSSQREVRIPWDSDLVPPNAVAICTAIGPKTPTRMLNRVYLVGGSDGASQGTACHLEILEILT